jgi:hypothetical protein
LIALRTNSTGKSQSWLMDTNFLGILTLSVPSNTKYLYHAEDE